MNQLQFIRLLWLKLHLWDQSWLIRNHRAIFFVFPLQINLVLLFPLQINQVLLFPATYSHWLLKKFHQLKPLRDNLPKLSTKPHLLLLTKLLFLPLNLITLIDRSHKSILSLNHLLFFLAFFRIFDQNLSLDSTKLKSYLPTHI
jgi:hypothetical protein